MTSQPHETKPITYSKHILLIGTKTGKCDICKVTKKVLLLKYGFTFCEDCLSACSTILEQLESQGTKQKSRAKPVRKERASVKKSLASKVASNKGQNNPYLKLEAQET